MGNSDKTRNPNFPPTTSTLLLDIYAPPSHRARHERAISLQTSCKPPPTLYPVVIPSPQSRLHRHPLDGAIVVKSHWLTPDVTSSQLTHFTFAFRLHTPFFCHIPIPTLHRDYRQIGLSAWIDQTFDPLPCVQTSFNNYSLLYCELYLDGNCIISLLLWLFVSWL